MRIPQKAVMAGIMLGVRAKRVLQEAGPCERDRISADFELKRPVPEFVVRKP